MQDVAVEKNHCARLANYRNRFRASRHDFEQLFFWRDIKLVTSGVVELRLQAALFVTARNEVEAAIHFGWLVKHDQGRCWTWFRHTIALPGSVVVVPCPDRTVNCGLQVAFGVMDVEPLIAEQVLSGL